MYKNKFSRIHFSSQLENLYIERICRVILQLELFHKDTIRKQEKSETGKFCGNIHLCHHRLLHQPRRRLCGKKVYHRANIFIHYKKFCKNMGEICTAQVGRRVSGGGDGDDNIWSGKSRKSHHQHSRYHSCLKQYGIHT